MADDDDKKQLLLADLQKQINVLKEELLPLEKQFYEARSLYCAHVDRLKEAEHKQTELLYADVLLISLLLKGGDEYKDMELGNGVWLYALIAQEVRAAGNLSLRALPSSALNNPLLSVANLQAHGLNAWTSRNLVAFLNGQSSLGWE